MKKLLSLFVLWGMVAVGCTEGGIDDSINNEQPGDDKIPENIFFAVDKESATIAPDGGSVGVVVYSNYKWEISGTSDWCTPSMKNGDANEDGQKVTFAADVAYDDREAIFWFRCADEKIKFVVSQRFKEVIIPDANNTFDVPAKGGVAVISYQTTVDCEVIIPEEAKGWIFVANTRALVSENINLAVAENTTYSARTAVVKVVAKGNADLVAEYTINQAQNDGILADGNNTFTVPSKGGEVVIDYQTNVDCEVIIPEDAQSWITIVPETRGLTAQSAALQIAENTTYDPRSAVIKVVAKGNSEVFAEYTINQEQNDAILADENKTFTVPCKGGEVVIDYQTNVDCEVVIPVEAKDWITVAPATRGLTAQSAKLHVAENTTYSARIAVVKIVAKDNSEVFAEYTINQAQNDGILADGNNTFTVPSKGGEVVIDYQTNVHCEVIIPEDAQDWITIAPATRSLVARSAMLQIAENTTYDPRSAIVKVVAKDNAELVIEFSINQKQKGAVLADENKTFTVSSKGDDIVLDYQTSVDCEIIIPNNAQSWISIVPETRGLTAQSARLHVAENTTYSARKAVVKVVSKDDSAVYAEYTINQEQNDALIADGVSKFNIGGYEQQISIKHKANVNCEVIIPVEAQDWITVAPATRGLVTYSTILNIAENNTGKKRQAIVKVVSLDNRELFAEYNITQNVRYCLYYTSNDGNIVSPYNSSSFNANILSNTYQDGVGVIDFDAPLRSIETKAFYYCSNLTSITIPNTVTTIGESTFESCYSLTSVTIPSSVTKIGKNAFSSCAGELIIHSKVLETDYTKDDNPFSYSNYGWLRGAKFTKLTIGEGVKKIGDYAFYMCTSLRNLTIPDSVTMIGNDAFYGCSNLRGVTIPDSVTTIGNDAFYSCTGELIIHSKIIETDYISHPGWLNESKFTKLIIGESVEKIGDYVFSNCASLRSLTIPDSVTEIGNYAFSACSSLTSITIPNRVTTIGIGLLQGCSSLTGVVIPNSVTTIDDGAFSACSSLTSLTIPDSVTTIGKYAFSACSSLTSLTIPDSVTTIGNGVFSKCSSLTSITIPNRVTTIEEKSFNECLSLTSVVIGDSVTTIGQSAFQDCVCLTDVIIPDSVTTIEQRALSGCRSLTSVTIGNGVAEIERYAFESCYSLTSVTIPDSVTTIGVGAFYGCTNVTSVTIPNSVTTIGGSAFSSCKGELIINSKIVETDYTSHPGWLNESKFTKLIIGESIEKIGEQAFRGCYFLTSVTVPNSVTTIGTSAFMDCKGELIIHSKIVETDYARYNYPSSYSWLHSAKFTKLTIGEGIKKIGSFVFADCDSITSVTIPDSVASIGNYAFAICDSITSVTIGNSVTSIGQSAFESCISLASVTIGNSVTTIGEYAFSDCSGLTSVTIPNSVTTIDQYVFSGCSSLTSVYCKPITPPVSSRSYIIWDAFNDNASDRKIYVPMQSVSKYKSASLWRDYSNVIVGYNF